MAGSDSLGIGLYTLAEASRLLRIPRPKLDGWVKGYVRHSGLGSKSYAPVLRNGGPILTFGDLIELRYVREFRGGGVSLQKLRQVAVKYGELWETDYPLATQRFATDGRSLLLKEGEEWADALNGQRVAFDEVVSTLVHLDGITSEWRPLGRERGVSIDPNRSFGRPIERESGAQTHVLFQALKAGDTAAQVAWWYGISEQAVLDANEFEQSLTIRTGGRAA